ncbi:dihydrolipoamide dehydrogenase [Amycolatopsis marina]|uniref:Dihydrolipoamide dehydrogenase n=1 Tax=Amycolatopsis marina TaxID=490629 RepID=A0A1I1CJ86_9PSEU|nr:NAD(P)/FAD-dependent oxidoreductase [Amycolatopsis marina]SFB62779.1 dihydrolipoamide dehydrogenase [Amycolatopsis marina]
MVQQFDVIVVGMGPGGEVVAGELLAAGKRVAVVERELIGGECGYWACIPSKTLLRPPESQRGVDRAAGVDGARLDWSSTREYRDYMIRHLDDSNQVAGYEKSGATVIKGTARITGPGAVEVDGQQLRAADIVIATGSSAVVPPIEGLDRVPVWTNREATTLTEIPARVVMIGGSAVGVELGLFLARYGAQVTMLERSARLLSREDPRPGELTEQYLREDGVDVRTNATARRVRRDGADTVVELEGGGEVRCDVIVVGTGRSPRTDGLGLDRAGVRLGERGGVSVDEHCRAGDGVWAVGDVTGVMPFTHVAMYQGRVVVDNILGTPRTARYEGIPRVVFADPEIAAVGLTAEQAQNQGLPNAAAEVDLAQVLARPWTYETDPRGHLGVLADRERRVLLGAWAVGPQASEWIHTAALAVREQIPIDRLLDQIAQFPTYNEGYLKALQNLDLESRS